MTFANVAIVLSGGLSHAGKIPRFAEERVEYAIDNLPEYSHIIFSSRYTLNRPQVANCHGYVVTEAKAMYDYFRNNSPRSDLKTYLELSSTDTIGSALFSFNMIKDLNLSLTNLTLITSSWHLPRVKEIFSWSARISHPDMLLNLHFPIIKSDCSIVRKKREKQSLLSFKENWSSITTEAEAWEHLYESHDNYSVNHNSKYVSNNNDQY